MKRILSVFVLIVCSISVTACSRNGNVVNVIKTFFLGNTESDSRGTDTETDIENNITLGVVQLDTYNPLITQSKTMKNMLSFVFEPMFGVNSDMTTVGVLAKSYQTFPDGAGITINLKENVHWHDGTILTASDIVYTFNALKTSDTNYSYLVKDIKSIQAVNEQTVQAEFYRSIPNPVALFSFPIIKNGSLQEKNFAPNGTGPFKVSDNKLIANTDYHNGTPKLDFINVKSVPDDEKFISLFNASVIDIADSDMIDITSYVPKSNTNMYNYVSNKMIFVGFNCNSAVFKFPEARRSVSRLIDRRSIVTHIYFSRAVEAVSPINPKSIYYSDNGFSLRSDISAADADLKKNGWSIDRRGIYNYLDQKTLTYFSVSILVNSESEERVKIAEQLAAKMKESGMTATVVKCSKTEFSSKIQNGKYDMFIGETDLLPNNDLTELLATGSNLFGFSDNELDVMLSQIGTLSSQEDIKAVWKNISSRVEEMSPIAPICFTAKSLVTSAKLKSGVEPSLENSVRRTENWSVDK